VIVYLATATAGTAHRDGNCSSLVSRPPWCEAPVQQVADLRPDDAGFVDLSTINRLTRRLTKRRVRLCSRCSPEDPSDG
jgi:hypothetical protein